MGRYQSGLTTVWLLPDRGKYSTSVGYSGLMGSSKAVKLCGTCGFNCHCVLVMEGGHNWGKKLRRLVVRPVCGGQLGWRLGRGNI